MNKNEIIKVMEERIRLLNYFTKLYDEGNPAISDQEWDSMYFDLAEAEKITGIKLPNSPTSFISYEVVNDLKKVTHSHPMLSLAKTKSIDEIKSFIGKNTVSIMGKLDGLTCSLTYLNGILTRAETRGNGEVGEDVLHNVKQIKNVPLHINDTGLVIIDGEVICTHSDFEKVKDDYKNPRNYASGSLRLLDSKESSQRHLTFVAWDYINSNERTHARKLDVLEQLGFDIVPELTYDEESIIGGLEEVFKQLKASCIGDYGYPIDGLVVKYDDVDKYDAAGRTEHHFSGAMAFKFEDETCNTRLVDIEYTMGRTGELTPVAVFEPIELEGTTVERASLHNLSIMEELSEGFEAVGDIITIYKANQIIPQVLEWKHDDTTTAKDRKIIYVPEVCPVCGSRTVIKVSDSGVKTLHCDNPQCEGKLINIINHFCSKGGLDIKGLSKKTLEKLIDWGWINTIEDIFALKDHRTEWIEKSGFGIASVDKILTNIENSKTCKLETFITALGIPLIGSSNAKEICKHIDTWYTFRELIDDCFDFSEWDTFGEEKANSILNFDYSIADDIVLEHIDFIADAANEDANILDGLTFVITGKLGGKFKNREAIKAFIEEKGGKVSGSVSKNTSYLINNNPDSTSSKNKTAKTLGVEIITVEKFLEIFDFN